MNLSQNRNRFTDTENKLLVTRGNEGRGKLEIGISRYRLLYKKNR